MRVHELSKEIDVPSKELVEYLSRTNSDIKTHMSSVSEEEAQAARKHFSKETKTADKPVDKPAEKAADKPAEKPAEKSAENAPKKENPGGQEAAPKKEKRIYASFNPQNSGRKEVRDQRRPDNRQNKPGDRNGKSAQEKKPEDRKPIRPLDRSGSQGDRPSDRVRPDGSRVENRPAKPSDRANRSFDRPSDRVRTEGAKPFEKRPDDRRGNGSFDRKNDDRRKTDVKNDFRKGGDNKFSNDRRNDSSRGDRPQRGNDRPGFGSDDRRSGGRNNDGRFRRDDRNSAPAFDGSEAIKDRETKEQRNRDRENRKKNNDAFDKAEKLENTKAFEKNFNKAKQQQKKEEEETIKTLILPDMLTIKELAEKMKIAPAMLVKKLLLKGTIVTVNQDIDFETAEEIALEFNCICEHEIKVDVIEELLREEEEPEELLKPRPPVVCVMGHVDHGKTSLLDKIRSSKVTEKEAGGITQHIGAYTVQAHGQDITFLDTPGHEAFTAMRLRGAKSTDIAILVVAADDGVMPQTIEAINHAKAAGIEIVVAINKIDKPSANIDRVKQELIEYELVAEDWGGSTIFCPVSAHTGEGIDNLLDMLLLTAEILELKANPDRRARGLVIEGRLDKGKGPVATMLVQKGTLHVGDPIAVGSCYGKIRAMVDDKGRRISEAGPSIPVEILGLNDVPNAGDVFVAPENEKEARNFAETFIREGRVKLLEDTKSKMSLDDLFSQIQAGNLKELNIIVKADVQGSVEAVKQSLVKLSNEEVVVKVIHAGVGAINESDVSLAAASSAIIIGFNVRPDNQARLLSESENVDLRLYRVIYQAIEDVEAAMKGMLDPKFEEKIIGHAEVRQTYKASGVGVIAGAYVLDGVITRNSTIRLMRGTDMIYDGPLASLKRFKDDAKEVKEGYECGCVLEKFNDIVEGDILEAYTMVEIPR